MTVVWSSLAGIQRILDIDLDFFLHNTANWREEDAERLDAAAFPPWDEDAAVAFLRGQCNLRVPLPGRAVEHHAEVFSLWRDAIDAGVLSPPFSVTHVDAHADLGLGDPSWVYLLSEVVSLPLEKRGSPKTGPDGLNDGSWLAFAVACRWVADLTYVFNGQEGKPTDLHPYLMEEWDPHGSALQLAAVDPKDSGSVGRPGGREVIRHLEPMVPLMTVPWAQFRADGDFDLVYLTRSPAFTPPESDRLYDVIRDLFIAEQ